MAGSKVEKKKKKTSRKLRTEAPIPVLSSDSEPTSPVLESAPSESKHATTVTASNLEPDLDPEQAFDSFYLGQATREFGHDLDKLRLSVDFRGPVDVAILVDALRQGRACFTPTERQAIGRAAAKSQRG